MKTILFSLSILISTTLFSQNKKITEKIINFKTIEQNKKNVVFSKISSELNQSGVFSKITSEVNISFAITANNGNSKDYTSCEWNSFLSYNAMVSFIEQLSVIDIKKEKVVEYNNFVLKVKRNKIRIQFVNSKCIQQHKTHYFQESCNRTFSFILTNDQKQQLITQMGVLLNNQNSVKK